MLQLRPHCEYRNRDLAPDSKAARYRRAVIE